MSNNDQHSFLRLESIGDVQLQPYPELTLCEFNGTEEISVPFCFELGMLSPRRDIRYEDVVGHYCTVSMLLANDERRYFNGLISRFAQMGSGEEGRSGHHMFYYTATMVPWLWLLTRYMNSRIYQNKSVRQIIDLLLKTEWDSSVLADLHWDLAGEYVPRPYCAQYHETDFDFISRLLEEEGIFYFFRHEQGRHTLVLADDPGKHPPCPHLPNSIAQCGLPRPEEPDVIMSFQKTQEIRFGKCTLWDFKSESPYQPVRGDSPSKYNMKKLVGIRELYDYPGLHPGILASKKSSRQAEDLAKIRIEQEEARFTTIAGSSSCRAFAAGTKIKVRDPGDYYRDDLADKEGKDYILVSVSHTTSQSVGPSGASSGEGAKWSNSFTCIPLEVPYRPPRYTPKPLVQGTQTAIVTGRGQEGEEIYTDGPCQVKVKFHWDRSGKKGDTSCWIRVAQPWAGSGWGAVHVPRIGQEVVVDFLEGDPDRPIIIGSVYDGANKSPFEGGKISGLKSNSTPGGGGYNEMIMDDTKGNELIRMHGQYDMDTTIEHDLREHVLNDRSRDVSNNETVSVGSSQSVSIGSNQSVTIGKNKTVKVGAKHDETIGGSMTVKVGGSRTVTVTMAETENVLLAKMLNIGAAYQVSVGAAMNETVGGAKMEEVGAYRLEAVAGRKQTTVGGNWVLSVSGDMQEAVDGNTTLGTKGNLESTTDGNSKALVKGNLDQNVDGNATVNVKGNLEQAVDGDIKGSATKIKLTAKSKIELSCGSSTIAISASEITIKGPMVKIN
jgi:type VI secretion system secreted protein VgrG